jgi:hypothetical protein
MKKLIHKFLIAIILFTSVSLSLSAQIDTIAIQKMANRIPASKTKNPDILATALCEGNATDASKVTAISYWIATHVDYDYKGYVERRAEVWSPETVLKKRKALCGEYATLFQQMCKAVNIKAEIVGGYTKEIDFTPNDTLFRSNHAWSAVQIDGTWKLIDLTFASGVVIPSKQPLKKITKGIFGMPYKPAYTFKKKYDSQWILADPLKMVYTHLPELSMFQLLQNPVPFSIFAQGDKAIEQYLASNSAIDTQNTAINDYISKSAVEKYIYNGEEGWKNNTFNNSLRGYMYMNALDSMYEKYFDSKTKMLDADRSTLKQMKRYAFLSDSLLKQTLKDNDQEFIQLQKRSESWKENLKSSNKQYIADLKARVKQNNGNIKLSNKSNSKGKTMTSYFNSKYNQFRKIKPINDLRRPKTPDSTAARQSRLLMYQQDSIWKLVCLKNLIGLYKANEPYTMEKVTAKVNTEQEALSIYDSNYQRIKQTDAAYAEGVPLAHTTPDFIQKKWLGKGNAYADSLKKANIDVMEGNLYNSQLQFFDFAKQYTKSTKDRLTMIKTAKRGSGTDQKEDSTYSAVVRRFTRDMEDFQLYLKPYVANQNNLSNYLENQNNRITNIIDKLQKESDVENFRHNSYMQYRQKIRMGENSRTKLALKQINKYTPIIDRSLQAKKK